jgi:transcriptional regulator with PAS, ATPase and Fis domain
VPLLAEAFLAEFRARLGKDVSTIHPDALALLGAHPWPGNVRELRNVIERGVLLEKTSTLLPSSIPFGAVDRTARAGSLRGALAAEERRLLADALRRAHGVKREAARLLGVDERNLAYYLRKHDL